MIYVPHNTIGDRLAVDTRAFGQLVEVLGPDQSIVADSKEVARTVTYGLREFDIERDFFLPIGDPALIAIFAQTLARDIPNAYRNDGPTSCYYKMLRWDSRRHEYDVITIRV